MQIGLSLVNGLLTREGIARRLNLAEERPPTEEDYCGQLAIR